MVEHGTELIVQEEIQHENKKNFHVAFLGGINVAKGYGYAVDLIKRGKKNIKWHLFGMFEREDTSIARRANFVNVGKYEREDLPRLFREYAIDLVCVLPIWPETFCYTISEAIMCGVPVLVTDIGALGERVRAMECGWIVSHGASSSEILDKIQGISKDKDEYQRVIHNLSKIHHRTVTEMCEIYSNWYSDVAEHDGLYEVNWLIEGYATANNARIFMGQNQDTLEMQLYEVKKQLSLIESSFMYRFVRKIGTINWPFKRQIKSLLKNIYRVIRKRK